MKTFAKLDIQKYKNLKQDSINQKFLGACSRGDNPLIHFLFENKDIPFLPQIENSTIKEEAFEAAKNKGGIDTLKLLLAICNEHNIEIPSINIKKALFSKAPGIIDYFLFQVSNSDYEEVISSSIAQDYLDSLINMKAQRDFQIKNSDINKGLLWGKDTLYYALQNNWFTLNEEIMQIIAIDKYQDHAFHDLCHSRWLSMQLEQSLEPKDKKTTLKI